jgi:hypothetical protein
MATNQPNSHLRLPQRAEAVAGSDQKSGDAKRTNATTDPRTSSQDPSVKTPLNSEPIIEKP